MLSLKNQFKTLFPLLLKLYIPILLVLGVLIAVNLLTHIRISVFTRDPSQVMEAPLYYGIISNIGILFWCATAAICLFVSVWLRATKDWRAARFFLFSGLLTLFLLCDDLFLFHEELFPVYLHVPSIAVYAGYGLIVVGYLIKFHAFIRETESLLFGLALVCFALSLAIDIPDIPFYGQHLFEDGFKLFGIVSWAAYFIRSCHRRMVTVLSAAFLPVIEDLPNS